MYDRLNNREMAKMRRNGQKGEVSLATLIVLGFLFLVLVFSGFKFFPVINERGTIKKAIAQTSAGTYDSEQAAKQKLLGLLGNDSIRFADGDYTLTAKPAGGGQYHLELSWKKRVEIIGGKKIVFNFNEKTK
jgi:hypothetical protein